ncbi:MAG: MGMT family protein [Bacteroidota bacterium]
MKNDKNIPSYFAQVFAVTRKIPRGRVTNYGAIANFLTLGSARMAGWALNKAYLAEPAVPAHRVVNRKGELSGRNYFSTPTMMQELLEAEGITVEKDKVVDFKQHFWDPSLELIDDDFLKGLM